MTYCEVRYAQKGIYAYNYYSSSVIVNLTDCLVERCLGYGIYLYENVDGTLLRTTVQNCSSTGIYITYGGDATIRECVSQGNGGVGLCVYSATALIEDCNFINNGYYAVEVYGSGYPGDQTLHYIGEQLWLVYGSITAGGELHYQRKSDRGLCLWEC